MSPSPEMFEYFGVVRDSADFANGLFVGTFWLIVVLACGWLALAIIDGWLDP